MSSNSTLWLSLKQQDLIRAVDLSRAACRGTAYEAGTKCEGFIHHKIFTAKPDFFLNAGMNVYRTIQRAGQLRHCSSWMHSLENELGSQRLRSSKLCSGCTRRTY